MPCCVVHVLCVGVFVWLFVRVRACGLSVCVACDGLCDVVLFVFVCACFVFGY